MKYRVRFVFRKKNFKKTAYLIGKFFKANYPDLLYSASSFQGQVLQVRSVPRDYLGYSPHLLKPQIPVKHHHDTVAAYLPELQLEYSDLTIDQTLRAPGKTSIPFEMNNFFLNLLL